MRVHNQHHIAEAHRLGLHDDNYFHSECPTCFGKVASRYREECHAILNGAGEGDEIEAFDRLLTSLLIEDEEGMTFHDDPAELVAEFLGAPLGAKKELDNHPIWRKVEAAAKALRQAGESAWFG